MKARCHPERSARLTFSFAGRASAESKDPYTCKKSQCGRPAQQQVWDLLDHKVPSTPRSNTPASTNPVLAGDPVCARRSGRHPIKGFSFLSGGPQAHVTLVRVLVFSIT